MECTFCPLLSTCSSCNAGGRENFLRSPGEKCKDKNYTESCNSWEQREDTYTPDRIMETLYWLTKLWHSYNAKQTNKNPLFNSCIVNGLSVIYKHHLYLRVLSFQSCPTLYKTVDYIAYQAPLCMGFSRQEYWRGLPYPPSGDLPDTGIETTSLMSPALASRFFTTSARELQVEIRGNGVGLGQAVGALLCPQGGSSINHMEATASLVQELFLLSGKSKWK